MLITFMNLNRRDRDKPLSLRFGLVLSSIQDCPSEHKLVLTLVSIDKILIP
jgi:hypothetical protein